MNYAEIENGVIVNIVYLHPSQEDEFPNCVPIPEGLLAEPGDSYAEGRFWRDGVEVKSTAQELAEAREILLILGGETV